MTKKKTDVAIQKVSNYCNSVGMTRAQRKFYMQMFDSYSQY